MIGKVIAVIHLIIAFLYSFYAFIFPRNFVYDYLYFVLLTTIQISWLLFNHECPFSYFYKKIHYPNYQIGHTTSLDDFNELNESSKTNNSNSIVDTIFTIFLIASIIITGIRSKLANIFLIIFVYIFLRFLYIYLNNALGYETEKIAKKVLGARYHNYEKMYYNYNIHNIKKHISVGIMVVNISFLIYITYQNRKRFK
jgi:hypothetical protein